MNPCHAPFSSPGERLVIPLLYRLRFAPIVVAGECRELRFRRPSCLDLITLLRKEMQQQPELLAPLGLEITDQALVNAAAA